MVPLLGFNYVLGLFKPTFLKRDAPLALRIAGLPAPFGAGRWKRRNSAEATPLHSRAGFERALTAAAGEFGRKSVSLFLLPFSADFRAKPI